MINRGKKMAKKFLIVFRKSEDPPEDDPFEGMEVYDKPPVSDRTVVREAPRASFLSVALGITPKEGKPALTDDEAKAQEERVTAIMSRPPHQHFQSINPMLRERSIPLF